MHVVLAFTYSHDRLLQPIPDKPSAAELFHNYKGAALFNYRLSQDATPSERDAIVSLEPHHVFILAQNLYKTLVNVSHAKGTPIPNIC